MRHIRYINPNNTSINSNSDFSNTKSKKDDDTKNKNKDKEGFFGSMSKTTKYILIGLAIVVILLIIYLIYRSSSSTKQINTHSTNIKQISTNHLYDSDEPGDLDIISNADYNEILSRGDIESVSESVSETGTIDDIIINGPETGKPIANMKYIYF